MQVRIRRGGGFLGSGPPLAHDVQGRTQDFRRGGGARSATQANKPKLNLLLKNFLLNPDTYLSDPALLSGDIRQFLLV